MNPNIQGLRRRAVFKIVAVAVTAATLRAVRGVAAQPEAPKEGGLSSEGLLTGQPGFHPRTAAPLPYSELPDFLSHAQLDGLYAEYVKAMEALKAAEQALGAADRGPGNRTAYAALRHQQVASANAVLLYDFYFGGLAPAKVAVPSYVQRNMHEHMGSMESWAADFTACAMAAHTWAALIYDPYDDRWHNTVMDTDTDGVWIGGNPLVVCNVGPQAYSIDSHREEYVAKFLDHIDWEAVAKRYRRVDRM